MVFALSLRHSVLATVRNRQVNRNVIMNIIRLKTLCNRRFGEQAFRGKDGAQQVQSVVAMQIKNFSQSRIQANGI